eukprot:151495-Chlamydomonas_euryale.AAC.2
MGAVCGTPRHTATVCSLQAFRADACTLACAALRAVPAHTAQTPSTGCPSLSSLLPRSHSSASRLFPEWTSRAGTGACNQQQCQHYAWYAGLHGTGKQKADIHTRDPTMKGLALLVALLVATAPTAKCGVLAASIASDRGFTAQAHANGSSLTLPSGFFTTMAAGGCSSSKEAGPPAMADPGAWLCLLGACAVGSALSRPSSMAPIS